MTSGNENTSASEAEPRHESGDLSIDDARFEWAEALSRSWGLGCDEQTIRALQDAREKGAEETASPPGSPLAPVPAPVPTPSPVPPSPVPEPVPLVPGGGVVPGSSLDRLSSALDGPGGSPVPVSVAGPGVPPGRLDYFECLAVGPVTDPEEVERMVEAVRRVAGTPRGLALSRVLSAELARAGRVARGEERGFTPGELAGFRSPGIGSLVSSGGGRVNLSLLKGRDGAAAGTEVEVDTEAGLSEVGRGLLSDLGAGSPEVPSEPPSGGGSAEHVEGCGQRMGEWTTMSVRARARWSALGLLPGVRVGGRWRACQDRGCGYAEAWGGSFGADVPIYDGSGGKKCSYCDPHYNPHCEACRGTGEVVE